MGRVTIPARWPSSAALSDYASTCGICGAPWRRSQLRYDTRGYLVCPLHGSGLDPAELSLLNAESAEQWAAELASRPPRDEPMDPYPIPVPAPGGFYDPNDPSLVGDVTDRTGLFLWLKAAQNGVYDWNTDAVIAIGNKAGGEVFDVPSSAAQHPLYEETGLCGRPCIRFDGSDDAIRLTGSSRVQTWFGGADTPFHCFMVVDIVGFLASHNNSDLFQMTNLSATNNWMSFGFQDNAWLFFRRSGDGVTTGFLSGGTPALGRQILECRFTGTAVELFSNGVSQLAATANVNTLTGLNALYFARTSGASNPANIRIAEALFYSTLKSPAESAAIRAELDAYYIPELA